MVCTYVHTPSNKCATGGLSRLLDSDCTPRVVKKRRQGYTPGSAAPCAGAPRRRSAQGHPRAEPAAAPAGPPPRLLLLRRRRPPGPLGRRSPLPLPLPLEPPLPLPPRALTLLRPLLIVSLREVRRRGERRWVTTVRYRPRLPKKDDEKTTKEVHMLHQCGRGRSGACSS